MKTVEKRMVMMKRVRKWGKAPGRERIAMRVKVGELQTGEPELQVASLLYHSRQALSSGDKTAAGVGEASWDPIAACIGPRPRRPSLTVIDLSMPGRE
ncbi:hypothetical protein FKP32DRAFT_1593173 [Trametes sanguinea]|nr:hypothetical protein FKP32DRAFT_1593173 [Trametes sanguinea]